MVAAMNLELNKVQAVGRVQQIDGKFVYELFELR
jgi:hypothetical protein